MVWRPRHEAHAIERVRVMLNFAEPVPSKLLRSATSSVVDGFRDFGFDFVEPADSGIGIVALKPNSPPTSPTSSKNGFVMKRFKDSALVEEVGFRDVAFGYVTTTYGRWSNLKSRIESVIYPSLAKLSSSVDLESIKLEYWDSFKFDGEPLEANASLILSQPDQTIPNHVLNGASLWHSHAGWFEGEPDKPILVNKNCDLLDQDQDGKPIRVLGVYTLIEQRTTNERIPLDNTGEVLDFLHNRSATIFGETLKEDFREMIGLDLEAYK